jgi:Na+/H+ antiporter NhaD/arsenite permease-like protein
MHQPSWWMVVPFGVLIASMAILPLHVSAWWERHYAKLALFLAALTLCFYFPLTGASLEIVRRSVEDYLGFILLIGSLYVVAGGIHVQLKIKGTPAENTLFLAIGGILANVLGTTGASMLLIRPWLRLNGDRTSAHHIVFFIFIISNVGGLLTPIGDPPLLIGFLKGVPFWWVLEHCWAIWLLSMGFLLGVFYWIDRRTPREPLPKFGNERVSLVVGLRNVLFLAVIAVIFIPDHPFVTDAMLLAAAAASYLITPRKIHVENQFSFRPIIEVAVLFFAIFITMIPMIELLMNAGGRISPAQVYWASGTLSGFLDSAPAYLAFYSAIHGQLGLNLVALSAGTVLFGALTYVGNGPNLMVKSIADHRKIPSPGFLAYLFKWAVPVMLPLLVIVWLVFFR